MVLQLAYQYYTYSTIAMASGRGRGRLYDAEATLNMILDGLSDAESDDELGEPVCPGSDEEFPDPDYDDTW